MPDGKTFYLNKPGTSEQDILQTTSQIISIYTWIFFMQQKQQVNSLLKRAAIYWCYRCWNFYCSRCCNKTFRMLQDIDVTRAVISTVLYLLVFEGAINPISSKNLEIFSW
jgi:hypothetical protein